MNYPESEQILEEIKKARKILLNCHKHPDPDSVGSALAISYFLKFLGKEVKIVCPTKVKEKLNFLRDFEKIETLDFSKLDFSSYDLFISLDASSWDFATKLDSGNLPPITILNIDHHKTNTRYGNVNLVDENRSSLAEVLYLLFEDWGFKIDKDTASALMSGIIGDTGAFRFPGTTAETLKIAGQLMKIGADKDKIIFNIYFSVGEEFFRFWAEVLRDLKMDKNAKFAWAAIPYKKYVELGKNKNFKEATATNYFQSVDGTDFGIIMVEEEKDRLNFSLRSRTGFDVSRIAVAFGGGGHRYAAGGGIEGLPFDQAVEKVLETCRKYAKKTN